MNASPPPRATGRLAETEFIEKARGIRLLVLDVDGVLTDGGIVVGDEGRESKRFHVRDGFAIRCWQRAGGRVAVISGRSSVAVAHRCAELDIEPAIQGAPDKAPVFRQVLDAVGVKPAQTCVLGDDLPDLPMMRAAGIGGAVADAAEELLEQADWISTRPGGCGAVRELIVDLLVAQGHWTAILEHYRLPATS